MINSKLYNLRKEYKDQLESRIRDNFECPNCSEVGVDVTITNEDRIWEVKATCNCGAEYIYTKDPSFRGYVSGQYKYILKKEKPGTKVRFIDEESKYTLEAAPTVIRKAHKLRKFKFTHSTLPNYKK